MGLDTEHEAGVRLVSCQPNQLVLQLPASHVNLAKAWKHIVASAEIHGCAHLPDHPLYHRVEKMEFTKHPDTPKGGATVVLQTVELYSIAQVLPNVDFSYAVTPIESLHPKLQDEARKIYHEQKGLQETMLQTRRLELELPAMNTDGSAQAVVPQVPTAPSKQSGTVPTVPVSQEATVAPFAAEVVPAATVAPAPAVVTPTIERPVVAPDDDEPDGSPFNFNGNAQTWNAPNGLNMSALSGFTKGFKQSIGQVSMTNEIHAENKSQGANWKPMTHANFGWNFNYATNSTRNPQFKFTLPGMRGYVLLKNPYLKFLGNFIINFNSHWNDMNPFSVPPHVKLNTTFDGNAYINADLGLMANIYRDVSEDPFGRFNIPLLNNFTQETHFFQKVHFFIANIPVSLQPGVSVNLNAYHLGLFKGAVRLGVNMRLHVQATAKYDSMLENAAEAHFQAEALNVRLLPPTWMIYTKHLEFGALLTPSFWLKGGFGPVRDVTLELQLRPYCNVSITQEGEDAYGVQQQVMEKELVIMPFRAINLQIGTEWSVGIEANGRRIMTSTELSLGVVEFNDYVEHFRFGLIDQRKLLSQPIYVTLFKNGNQEASRVVNFYCESIVEGECQPGPFNAEFTVDGKPVIVQLTAAWHARPVPYLMSKVRAISIVFPQLALTREASDSYNKNIPTSVFIKITRNGREYRATQTATVIHDNLVMVSSNHTEDLGVEWIDGWRIDYGSISGLRSVTDLINPSIELFYIRNGIEERVAQTFMGQINWNNVLSGTPTGDGTSSGDGHVGTGDNDWSMAQAASGVGRLGSHAFGGVHGVARGSAFHGVGDVEREFHNNPREVWNGGFYVGNIPLRIQMTTETGQAWSDGRMGLDVHNPSAANRWLRPYRSEKFVQGSVHSLYWSTRAAVATTKQSFHFTAFKVALDTGVYTPTSMDMDLPDQACMSNNAEAQKFMMYGDECVYEQKLQVDPGLVGVTVVFQLSFRDHVDGTTHKMLSAPVMFVSQEVAALAASAPGYQSPAASVVNMPMERKLMSRLHEENGVMVDAPPNSDKEQEIQMSSLFVVKDDEEHKESPAKHLRDGSRRMQEEFGVTPSNISFQERMQELHPICSRKPLHYAIGAGIFFRAKVHNFNMPQLGGTGMGILTPLANLASFADMDTMDIPLANTALGKKMSELLPKGFCTEGVCDGTLPGCPGQTVHPMTIPKIEFKMDRDFSWNNTHTQDKAKEATAFAMALLPEVVRVSSIVVGSLIDHAKILPTTPMPGEGHLGDTGSTINYQNASCRWTKDPYCTDTFEYSGFTYNGCSVEDHGSRGWCSVDETFTGNWRNCELSCSAPNGTQYTLKNISNEMLAQDDQMPALSRKLQQDAPESNRFVVEFTPGSVQYKIDEDLIHALISRDAFRGIEDGREAHLGTARIVGFRLHRDNAEPTEDENGMIPVRFQEKFEMHIDDKSLVAQPSSSNSAMIVAGAAALGIFSLVAGIYRGKRNVDAAYVTVEPQE